VKIEKVGIHYGGTDAQASQLRDEILSSQSPCEESKGTVYYAAQNGSDENDGRCPDFPLKSISAVGSLHLCPGDSVLFQRGSVFRTGEPLKLVSGVHYGAYGEGKKPEILGSLREYADETLWQPSGHENIWMTELSAQPEPAGCVTFNQDTYVGTWKMTFPELQRDGDFYHDAQANIFYMYLENINPGICFENIEISSARDLMIEHDGGAEDIHIDNICFKYATFGPFLFSHVKHISITDCIMGWHGGRVFSVSDERVIRYGNAVEFWYQCDNIVVERCWVYQIFDAAMTFQGYADGPPQFTNIRFERNLIEYCSMNIEFWAGQEKDNHTPHIENISIQGNMIRFAGYGWGGVQRADKENQAMILGWNRLYEDLRNFVISDNVLDCADCSMIYTRPPAEQFGLTVQNNSFYQKKVSGTHGYVDVVRGSGVNAENQEELEKTLRTFDSQPKIIQWISNTGDSRP